MQKIAFRTKSELAYERLRAEISDGLLEPGERLVIQNISQQFGVSDIPVREAMKKLEAEGFVESVPHLGFVVSKPNFKQQLDIFEVRKILECSAVELASANMTEQILSKLRQYQEKMRELCEVNKGMFSRFNYQFHDTIYASSGNEYLYKLIKQTWDMVPRVRSIFTLIPGRVKSSIKDHERIYLALRDGDSLGARKAMAEHQEASFKLLTQYGNGDSLLAEMPILGSKAIS